MSVRLTVMRLADMHRMHPQQDNSRTCDLCGARVGIYPSGLSAIKAHPAIEIVCSVCTFKELDPWADNSQPAAGLDVILQEMRDSYPAKKG